MSKRIEKILPVVASVFLIFSGLMKPIITGIVGGLLTIIFLIYIFKKKFSFKC